MSNRGKPRLAESDADRCEALTVMTGWRRRTEMTLSLFFKCVNQEYKKRNIASSTYRHYNLFKWIGTTRSALGMWATASPSAFILGSLLKMGNPMNDTTFVVNPDLYPLSYGGWLATTGADTRIRIGVVGTSEEEARARFSESLQRWKEIHEIEEK